MTLCMPTWRMWVVVAAALTTALASHAEEADPVVRAIRDTSTDNTRLSACVQLARTNARANSIPAEMKKKAVEQVSARLKQNDPVMLRARADAARKGMYGFPKDETLALRLYERTKAPEAGLNAALMLYRSRAGAGIDPATAKRILHVLQYTGASAHNSRGSVGAQAHYIAGTLQESGAAGAADPAKAFTHYRASARNAYIPGAYHYLRLLSQSIPKLPESERAVVLQEMRMMTNRWRWQSAEIMLLTGDMYAAGWIPDDEGFLAQQHWRMALRMGSSREIPAIEEVLKKRIKRLSPEKEKRLDDAVEAGLRNVVRTSHELEFEDLCAE